MDAGETLYAPFVKDRFSLIIGPKQPKKTGARRKSKKKNLRGAGTLKNFTDLPLDVIYETVSFLEVTDLLNLVRTTKDFWYLLASRSALPIWKRAMSQVRELPPCPQDLNEMQYASLVFDKFCMACLSTRGSIHTDFKVRLRFCSTCSKNNLGNPHAYYMQYNGSLVLEACKLVPASFKDILPDNADDNDLGPPYDSSTNNYDDLYFKPELKAVIQRLTTLSSEEKSKSACDQFILEQHAAASRMINEGRQLALWVSNRETENAVIENEIMQRRRERILQEMRALGWEERYYPTRRYTISDHAQEWHRYIYMRKEFSERSWKMNLPKMQQIYNKSKKIQQLADLSERVRHRYLAFRSKQPIQQRVYIPSWGDARLSSPLSIFCEQNYLGCEDDIVEEIIPRIVEHFSPHFQEKVLKDFIKVVTMSEEPASADQKFNLLDSIDVLEKGTSLVTCSCAHCQLRHVLATSTDKRPIMTYSEILDHLAIDMPDHRWDQVKPQPNHLLWQVIMGILDVLHISPQSSLAQIEKNGSFQCRCGQSTDLTALSFRKLVEHVYHHRAWYSTMVNDAAHNSQGLIDELLVDSHSTEHLQSLIVTSNIALIPNSSSSESTSSENSESNRMTPAWHSTPVPPAVYCRSCYRILRCFRSTKDTMEYHMKHRHGKEMEPGDFESYHILQNIVQQQS